MDLLCAGHYLLGRSVHMWSLVCAGHYLLGRSVQMWCWCVLVIISLVGSVQMWSLVCAGHYLLGRECTDMVIRVCWSLSPW